MRLVPALATAPPRLVFPGGGIFFWWQAGVVRQLQKRFVVDQICCSGASAGALSATLAACGCDSTRRSTLIAHTHQA